MHSLEPLGELTGLRALAVEGGVWHRANVKSLAPLSRLTALDEPHLTSLRIDDESLRPLKTLAALTRPEIDGGFSTEELARLAGVLSAVECDWFAPYVVVTGPGDQQDTPQTTGCPRCGGTRVMPTGRRKGIV